MNPWEVFWVGVMLFLFGLICGWLMGVWWATGPDPDERILLRRR
jgi:hypothetical protein